LHFGSLEKLNPTFIPQPEIKTEEIINAAAIIFLVDITGSFITVAATNIYCFRVTAEVTSIDPLKR